MPKWIFQKTSGDQQGGNPAEPMQCNTELSLEGAEVALGLKKRGQKEK